MSNVVFDESPIVITSGNAMATGIVGLMLRRRIVRTAAQAQTVLLVVAACLLVASGVIFKSTIKDDTIDAGKNLVPAISQR